MATDVKPMTVDRALARVMELHRMSPGEDALRPELRRILDRLRFAGWSEGYDEGLRDGQ